MIKFDILKKNLNLDFSEKTASKLEKWEKIFLEYNSHTNLVSKKDCEVLFEKHVFDSLAPVFWKGFENCKNILDVGCGGGFPSVILAICFPQKKIIANDSRIKKINFIKLIKEELKLENLEIAYSRVEDLPVLQVDLITSRAVGKTLDIYELSKKHLKKSGKFLIFKSKLAQDEIEEFQKKYKNAKFEIISYSLPLAENFERCLLILK